MTASLPILPWLKENWDMLTAYIQQQRIPQALLITGHQGLGKHQLAGQFAQSLLCSNNQQAVTYCGHCRSCQFFKAGTHPDYLFLKPEEPGKNITINQIRTLIAKLALKPLFESYRVVMIDPAELMNNAAANGFLKCLEEPTERTVIILISATPARLPATIISRCQNLHINVPPHQVAMHWLQQQQVQGNLEALLSLAQGAPLTAKQYADSDMLAVRNKCFKSWIAVARKQISPVVLAEEWNSDANDQLVFWLSSWVMDLIKCHFQVQRGDLSNPDLHGNLQELVQKLDLRKLFLFYDLMLTSRQRFNSQLNKQLLFEEILIKWSQLDYSN
jgi:DNA polymerase III subunit delta'